MKRNPDGSVLNRNLSFCGRMQRPEKPSFFGRTADLNANAKPLNLNRKVKP